MSSLVFEISQDKRLIVGRYQVSANGFLTVVGEQSTTRNT